MKSIRNATSVPLETVSPPTRRLAALRVAALVTACALVAPVAPARADAIVEVAKNTLYGAATGFVLGAATSLVMEKGDKNDAVRWGIVIGTFGGFLYGVYEVTRNDYSYVPPDEELDPLVAAWGQSRWPDAPLVASPSPAALPLPVRLDLAR